MTADTGKTILIFLADGEPTGILLAEISNWTGKVLVAPRSQLDQLSKREEVRRTGVYLLVGPDPDDPSRALAYIGEGDNVLRAAAPPELDCLILRGGLGRRAWRLSLFPLVACRATLVIDVLASNEGARSVVVEQRY